MMQRPKTSRLNDAPRPLIGVTKPSRGDLASFWAICAALRRAGGAPVRLSAVASLAGRRLHGLVLGGGVDIHPARFGAPPKPFYPYDTARDEMEIGWLDDAAQTHLPTLGICRGAQLMNVAAGGTLHLDLAARFGWALYPQHWLRQSYFRKCIDIAPGSRLHEALGVERLRVNSVHRQAIDAPGAGLVVSAREANGIAQAIERPEARFWIGVQFHPEFLLASRPCRRLFASFVSAARERMQSLRASEEDAPRIETAEGAQRFPPSCAGATNRDAGARR